MALNTRSMDTHAHTCGGTILVDESEGRTYCDRCGAYRHGDGPLPTGTDREANRQAYDDGDEASPNTEAK